MMQVGRNLTDPFDGFLLAKRFLIMDRDKKFTEGFRRILDDAGTRAVRLPPRSPNLNGYVSYCTSSLRFGRTSVWTRLSESLIPCCLTGEFCPG